MGFLSRAPSATGLVAPPLRTGGLSGHLTTKPPDRQVRGAAIADSRMSTTTTISAVGMASALHDQHQRSGKVPNYPIKAYVATVATGAG